MTLAVYNGQAMINNTALNRLEAAANASIQVAKESDGLDADIFSDRAGLNALANPFTADSDGHFSFYAAGLDRGYKITVTKGSNQRVLRNVPVGLAQEHDDGTGANDIPKNSDLRYSQAMAVVLAPEVNLEVPAVGGGYVHGQAFALLAVTLNARTAPAGAALVVEVLKDGVATGTTATLTASSKYEKTTFGTPVNFGAAERMSFKITQVGATEPGNDLTITPHFRGGS